MIEHRRHMNWRPVFDISNISISAMYQKMFHHISFVLPRCYMQSCVAFLINGIYI